MKRAAVLALMFAACGPVPRGYEGKGVTRVEPSQAWARWFDEAAACTGLEGDHADPDWYLFDKMTNGKVPVGGVRAGNSIFVRRSRAYNPQIVKHEAIHWLLAEAGYDPDASHTGPWYECEHGGPTASNLAAEYGLRVR